MKRRLVCVTKPDSIRALPLRTAHLCVNCETVYDFLEANGTCPACKSPANVSLLNAIGTLGREMIDCQTVRIPEPAFHPEFKLEGTQTGRLVLQGAN